MMLTIVLLAFLGAVVTFAVVIAFYPAVVALAAAPFGGTLTAIVVSAVLFWQRSRGRKPLP